MLSTIVFHLVHTLSSLTPCLVVKLTAAASSGRVDQGYLTLNGNLPDLNRLERFLAVSSPISLPQKLFSFPFEVNE